jgi:hypothetical protein
MVVGKGDGKIRTYMFFAIFCNKMPTLHNKSLSVSFCVGFVDLHQFKIISSLLYDCPTSWGFTWGLIYLKPMILQLWAGLVPCWTLTATGSPG